MLSSNITRDFFSTEHSSETCTGFDPRKIYMLGQKYSGLKPRGVLQNYKLLKNYCLKKGTLFEDPQFPLEDMKMGDKWENMKNEIRWLRPKQIMANAKFILDGIDRSDINQGDLGDCWFLAAVADVVRNHKLMELIVPSDQSFDEDYCGIFHFRFWQYGRWIDIVVDDRLPTYKGELIFLKSSQENEFWTPLLEKAYAKLYCSYKNIEGGFTSEALQDLTGGLTEIYAELKKLNESINVFDMMMASYTKKSFMGCAITNTTVMEGERNDGLYSRHAYSITGVTEVNDRNGSDNFKLVRVRNPWGQREWKGNWSDNSTSWDLVSEDTRHHLLVRKDDGEFWIQYEDFIKTYTLLEFCHPNPDSLRLAQEEMRHWKSFMIDGAWVSKVTNGGLPKDTGVGLNFLKPGKGKNLPSVYHPRSAIEKCLAEHILFIHAVSGCDSTSALFKQGKVRFMKNLTGYPDLSVYIRCFKSPLATSEEISEAGEKFLVALYGGDHRTTSINKLRYKQYVSSAFKVSGNVASIPLLKLQPSNRVTWYFTKYSSGWEIFNHLSSGD